MNDSSQFRFHRDHSRMSKRHQEPALVFRELKPKCCFVLTRFQVFEVQGTEFWKPQAALGFGSSHTDPEEQCLEKCECPLCLGTVTVLSACPWRPLGVTKGPRKLTLTETQTHIKSSVYEDAVPSSFSGSEERLQKAHVDDRL